MSDRLTYLLEKKEVAGLDKSERYELHELLDRTPVNVVECSNCGDETTRGGGLCNDCEEAG